VFGSSAAESENEHSTNGSAPTPNDLTDEELVRKASSASNGEIFARLWSGDTGGYGSHSEADLALCGMLAFWTGGDPIRMDRLFRASGLYREKWERAGYRDGTISEALKGKTEFYQPPKTVKLRDGTEHRIEELRPEEIGKLLSSVEPEDVSWLWPSWLALGKLVLLDGDPGLGKSAMTLDLAARVSSGRSFPDGAGCEPAGMTRLTPMSASGQPRRAADVAAGAVRRSSSPR